MGKHRDQTTQQAVQERRQGIETLARHGLISDDQRRSEQRHLDTVDHHRVIESQRKP
jgi:hypothetical protein